MKKKKNLLKEINKDRKIGKNEVSGEKPQVSNIKKPLIAFIDNKDSFVWNLVESFSIQGAKTVMKPNTVSLQELQKISPDGIIISPGPGTPYRKKDVGNCLKIIKEINRPILGVCLGFQAIAIANGGKVEKSVKGPVHGKTSKISHVESDIFKNIPNPFQGGRYHSLIVKDQGNLETLALSKEGELMAAKHPENPIYGLQFHPESVLTPEGDILIKNFLKKEVTGKVEQKNSKDKEKEIREINR